MGTSDGISSKDWDFVHELAVDIVNATDEERDEIRSRLLGHLDRLQRKYGDLPSILATQADYVDDVSQREQLLTRAYTLAASLHDALNELEIAQSLAELYVETLKEPQKAADWLKRLKLHVHESGKARDKREYDRLRGALRGMNLKVLRKGRSK